MPERVPHYIVPKSYPPVLTIGLARALSHRGLSGAVRQRVPAQQLLLGEGQQRVHGPLGVEPGRARPYEQADATPNGSELVTFHMPAKRPSHSTGQESDMTETLPLSWQLPSPRIVELQHPSLRSVTA